MSRHAERSEHEADRAAAQALAGRVRSPLSATRPAPQAGAQTAPLSGLGRPLDTPLRNDMETRFGHSFAAVRVHADAAANAATESLGASAFTHGSHVAFGAGQYAPHTPPGRLLLAHELAHVVQQSLPGAVPRVQRKPKADTPAPTTTTAVKATAADKREFAQQAVNYLRGQGEFFSSLPKPRDPAKTLPALKTSLDSGLQVLAGDTSPDALKIGADLRGTYTDAVRALLSAHTLPAAGSTAATPTLLALYERHRALIEPFAHPVDAGAQELSAELEAPLPASPTQAQRNRHTAVQAARQRVQVSTSTVGLDHTDLFGPNPTRPPALPARMSARFASTVPAVLRPGLMGLVERMSHGILEPDSTLLLALDLRAFGGGNDAYRFTRLDLSIGGTRSTEVLVERQGAILSEGLGARERLALRKRFDAAGFVRDSSFSDTAEFDQVLIGIDEIPQGQLSALSGLRFMRGAVKPGEPNAGAEYDSGSHAVTVFDHAYAASASRQGRAGRVIRSAAYAVTHELGHAQDLSRLRTSATAFNAAQNAQMAEFRTGPSSFGIAGDAPAARRTRYDELDSARTTARKAQFDARSRSGARWNDLPGGARVTDTPPSGTATPAFRAAAAKDDGSGARRMPTNYPNPDSFWREYYAECYALYFSNPDHLRRTQPNVFAHLAAEFPK